MQSVCHHFGENESSPSSLPQDGLALTKAVQSGDTDLVYTALLQIQKTHPKKEFFKIIQVPFPAIPPCRGIM
jgi:hypothetical protein